MMYILMGITAICALLCVTELFVSLWEKKDEALRRRAVRRAQRAQTLRFSACLPDRDSVKNIYSLSDQFADRLWEVVHS